MSDMGGTERILLAQQQRLDEDAARAEELRLSLLVRAVVTETVKEHSLSSEEREWVRLAIKREGRRERFQTAVIEKTLAGLALAGCLALVAAAWELFQLKTGGPKP